MNWEDSDEKSQSADIKRGQSHECESKVAVILRIVRFYVFALQVGINHYVSHIHRRQRLECNSLYGVWSLEKGPLYGFSEGNLIDSCLTAAGRGRRSRSQPCSGGNWKSTGHCHGLSTKNLTPAGMWFAFCKKQQQAARALVDAIVEQPRLWKVHITNVITSLAGQLAVSIVISKHSMGNAENLSFT